MFYYINELAVIWMFNVDNYTDWASSAKWFSKFSPEDCIKGDPEC